MSKSRVLVDTSAWIMALRPGLSPRAGEMISELITEDLAVTLPVIILELLSGARTPKEFNELQEDMSAIPVLNEDGACLEHIYEHGFRLRRDGLNVPTVDVVISGAAMAHDCRLLHADKHFALMAEAYDLDGVSLL